MHYTARLITGEAIISELNDYFQQGTNQMIKCVEAGVKGLTVGDIVEFICPPELAFGEEGLSDLVPPNAPLIVEMEILSSTYEPVEKNPFKTWTEMWYNDGRIQVNVQKVGEGHKIKKGDEITITYNGQIYQDGEMTELRDKSEVPVTFVYGFGKGIPKCLNEAFLRL